MKICIRCGKSNLLKNIILKRNEPIYCLDINKLLFSNDNGKLNMDNIYMYQNVMIGIMFYGYVNPSTNIHRIEYNQSYIIDGEIKWNYETGELFIGNKEKFLKPININ